jgi:hypothetical protein
LRDTREPFESGSAGATGPTVSVSVALGGMYVRLIVCRLREESMLGGRIFAGINELDCL